MALTDDRPSARTGMIKHTSTTWRLKGSFYDKSAQSIFNFFSLLPNTYRKCHSSCHYVVQGVIIMISILICHLTRVNNKVCTVLLHIKQWGIDEKRNPADKPQYARTGPLALGQYRSGSGTLWQRTWQVLARCKQHRTNTGLFLGHNITFCRRVTDWNSWFAAFNSGHPWPWNIMVILSRIVTPM